MRPERANPRQLIPYPTGIARTVFRLPLLGYRLGLGGLLNAAHIMVLTTRGRSTGLPRHTPIEYRRHGSKIYVISAWGERPQWYQNLQADPLVSVQLGGRYFSARAQVVKDSAEALRVLHLFRSTSPLIYDWVLAWLADEHRINAWVLPDLADEFTIVRLERVIESNPLPAVRSDLVWVWLVAGLAGIATLVLGFTRSRRS